MALKYSQNIFALNKTTRMDRDYILCECPVEHLTAFVEQIEKDYDLKVAQSPNIGLTMLKAQDSVEGQEFYLGEALTTTCEVVIGEVTGYGIVLEDQPDRAYCIAIIDALAQIKDHNWPAIESFLVKEWTLIQQKEKEDHAKIMQSAVDFKLMEES